LSDDNSEREPPDPIPNSEVKPLSADGSVGSPHVRVGHRQASNAKTPSPLEAGFFYGHTVSPRRQTVREREVDGSFLLSVRKSEIRPMSLEIRPNWLPFAPWIFVLVWSAGYAVAKLALEYTTPLNLMALRFLGAWLFLLPLVLWFRPNWPDKTAIRDLLVVATCIQLVHFGCVYTGLSLGASASMLALFAASQPVLITLVAAVIQRQMPVPRVWMGLALGLSGAAWVIWVQGDFSKGVLIGAMLGFFAVVGLSIGQVYEKHKRPKCHPLLVYFIQYGYASVVSLPIAWWLEGYAVEWSEALFGSLLFLVLGNSLLGIFLMLTMVRFGAISKVTSIMFLVPGLAALIAWALIGEVMPVIAWAGVLFAAAGVLLVIYAPDQKVRQVG
jgi:drug/metabolite transporter (DMT)-like permease